MIREFRINRKLHVADCDRRGILQPDCVLRLLEDAASEHAQAVGQVLLAPRRGMARWVIARTLFRLERPLRVDEQISVHTAVRMPFSTVFYHDYELYGSGGLLAGTACNIWMLVGKESGKPLALGIPEGINYTKVVGSFKTTKINRFHFPAETSVAGSYRVRNSDLDLNDHMTNSRYADLCFDTLPASVLLRHYVAEMQVNYLRECILGDELTLITAEDETWHYVRGQQGDRPHFDARMKLAPI